MTTTTRQPATSADAAETTPDLVLLDGSADLGRDVLGGKAWGVNRMAAMKLPVPPAFCLPTTCCEDVNRSGSLTDSLRTALRDGIAHLERATDRVFAGGRAAAPLLVSVRSGAANSMPGMMDTVLNLGLNETTRQELVERSGNPALVAGIADRFHSGFLGITEPGGGEVPEDPWEQLEAAVLAVFASWHSPRAEAYRAHHRIDDAIGTAVTVQAMVFGNLDDRSGTGVVFSRNPVTGDRAPYGEWLSRAQGEDLVSGDTTPEPLSALAARHPEVYDQLTDVVTRLENDAAEVQDIEFTVESGRLWILQTRTAKRSPQAALRLAVGLAEDGLISRRTALAKVSIDLLRNAEVLGATSRPTAAPSADGTLLAHGTPAGPGRRSGLAVDDPDEAADLADEGVDVVLVRPTTSPDDVHGMFGAVAVVTDLGGSTSHAALVSREIGVACVVGCGAGTAAALVGRHIVVDGDTGRIHAVSEAPDDSPNAELAAPTDADAAVDILAAWARAELSLPDDRVAEPLPDLPRLLDLLESTNTER